MAVPGNQWRRRLTQLFALALFFLAVIGILWRLNLRGLPPERASTPVRDIRLDDVNPPTPTDPVLTLTIVQISPQTETMTVGIAASIPEQQLTELVDDHGRHATVTVGGSTKLNTAYAGKPWSIPITLAYPLQFGFTQVTARLDAQGWPTGQPTVEFAVRPSQITLPMEGHPDAYPLDWFSVGGFARLDYPDGLQPEGQGFVLGSPVRVHVVAGPAVVGAFHIARTGSANRDPVVGDAPATAGGIRGIVLYVRRPISSIVFVFVVLAVPVMLAFVLALATTRSGRTSHADARDVVIGLTAATLTLLPVRLVLVPSYLDAPTLVDWCLGAELLVFLGVAFWAVARGRE